MMKAPIAFFAYNRPEHTLRSLTSLAENHEAQESELFIFCDAAKKPEHQEGVDTVRRVAGSRQWCGSVHILEQDTNKGCAQSIINGVTKLCNEYGSVIIVEDDLVLSQNFLSFMNTGLHLYERDEKVMQISGFMFPVELPAETDAIFLPFTTSWGWATWDRAWRFFDPSMSGYDSLRIDRRLRTRFNLNGAVNYFNMLEAQQEGRIDSWAIRWYLSTFKNNGFTLYPKKTLVENIGFDGSGTHYRQASNRHRLKLSDFLVKTYPARVMTDQTCFTLIQDYFKPKKTLRLFVKKMMDAFLKR